MIIRYVEVRNFRKLAEAALLKDLGTGLLVIVGDNEEGKSTLFQAIRSGFFDKHDMMGERARSFQPYNSSLRPEVKITFELDGKTYTLFKAFCRQPEAELVTPTGRFSGGAAEEELGKLLRFTPAKRAKKDSSEHEGVFSMFWVGQGESFAALEPTEDSRSSIVQAMQKEVGQVLGGKRGRTILAEVTKRRSQLFTTTGRPKGEYSDASKAVSDLGAQLNQVRQNLADYDRKVDELNRCRISLERYQSDCSIERAQQRLTKAQEAQKKVELLNRTSEEAQKTAVAARVRQELAANKVEGRANLARSVEAAKRKAEQLETAWNEKHGSLKPLRDRVQREGEFFASAQARWEQAQEGHAAASAADQWVRLKGDVERLEQDERSALSAKTAQEKAVLAARGISIEKKDLTQLKRFQEAVTTSQAQLDALATRVSVRPEPGVKVRIAGELVLSNVERRITEPTVIQIPKSVEITITPGGDIGNPRIQLEQATQKLRQALTRMGVTSLAEAEVKLDERANYLTEAQTHEKLLAAHAPEGLEALRHKIGEARADLNRLVALCGTKPRSIQEASAKLETARGEREEAERGLKAANGRRQQAMDELAKAQEVEAGVKASYESELEHLRVAEDQLKAARNEVPDAELQGALLRMAEEASTAEQTATAAKMTLEQADPGTVMREVQMAEQSLNQTRDDIQDLRDKVRALEIELRAKGATGLEELKQELEAKLELAHAVLGRVEHEAKTLELLYLVLTEAEKEAKEIFLRPVSERVQPYLKLLLPGAQLMLNEEISIVGLQRGPTGEKFESLSLGTREQLAILTRLAFTDLLRERGQPTVVLLDEAIAYADDQRFLRMLHILQKAGQRLQIIVFTCRERDYRAAGAPIIRLADCRLGASS